MACFDYYGNVSITNKLVAYARGARRKVPREGLYGVTRLEFYQRPSRFSSQALLDLVSMAGFDISILDNADLTESALMMSSPLEMHDDGGQYAKYGILIMLDVPKGTVLLQNNGNPIYPVRGDVIGIRYGRQHGVEFPKNGSRLFFMSIDFRARKQTICDQWQALVNEARGAVALVS